MPNAISLALGLFISASNQPVSSQVTVLRNVGVLDGNGKAVQQNQDVTIKGDRIQSIKPAASSVPKGARVVDLTGKTIMPQLFNSHGHLGLLKGTTMSSANYTEDNIRAQLLRYETYGVGGVLVLGTDHEEIFGLRQASRNGTLPGAAIYTAGMGFGVKDALPPVSFGMDKVFRPLTEAEARQELLQLVAKKPDVIKLWVDDLWGTLPKMKPEVYAAIIQEAHRHGVRVASHVFYLEDARKLVGLGLDIIAHSIRDAEIDDALLAEMKKHKVAYIPTLSLDEFAFAYQEEPEWLNSPFFQAALEPGVLQMVTSAEFKEKVRKNPNTAKEVSALQNALKNVKRIHDAGLLVALGTDSGAQPIRVQGFSEHMELELLVKAGLTPLQAITVGTKNAATLLKVDDRYGTLAPGKKANFIVLDKDPSTDILNTRTISAVWKNGEKVNDGPFATLAKAK
jgi:imidazolonepropionase-like amidohydrolase